MVMRILFVLHFTLVIPALAQINLVENPSMEGDFIYQESLGYIAENWTGWQEEDYGWFSEGNYDHEGSKSQKIHWNGAGYDEFTTNGIYQQISSLQPGKCYRVSVWFKFCFQAWIVEPACTQGYITFGVGANTNGGTDPAMVNNWSELTDSYDSDIAWYEGPWLKVVTFFSPVDTTATLFMKASGYGDAWEVNLEPPYDMLPADWDAWCYIDDVNVVPIQIDPCESIVSATSPVPANNASYSEVTITVLDSSSNPIEGIPGFEIEVSCSGSGNLVIGPDSPTDVNGQTTARIVSTVAGDKTVGVTVSGTVLSETLTIHFCESNYFKLRASDGAASDNFGRSVAIDGNTAVVGAFYDDDNGAGSGSAYIFRFNDSNWVQEAKLLASDGAASDNFGCSVAIDGNVALVGADYDDDNGSVSGSAYIFRFNGSNWVQECKLLASDGAEYKYFGSCVAIDGNTALVGAYGNDDNGDRSGSAYIFRFDGSNWDQEAKLLAEDGTDYDYFGRCVAIDGNIIVVGANGDDDKGDGAGSAYIFRFNISNWVQEAKLLAEDGSAYHRFGWCVDIDGDKVLVGGGSAYIFRFNGSNWGQEAKLLASDGTAIGGWVAIDGNTALVGADGDDDNGAESGSAYIFRFDGSNWIEQDKLLASDGAEHDYFGRCVAIDSNTTLVGAFGDDDNGARSGAAYVFPALTGDLNSDSKVDLIDLSNLSEQWGQEPVQPSADIAPCGGDCIVDISDLMVFCYHWLEDTIP